MLAVPGSNGNARTVVFSKPPWDENDPPWQALDSQLEEGDVVRVIRQSLEDGSSDVYVCPEGKELS
ncbi:MAG: hypothetical protein IH991_01700 [Planctomycetes bacterium]|nr:hypothetical protein [Planctomycetota bacterium]